MSILYKSHLYFFAWPLNMDEKKINIYAENGVEAVSRGLEPLSVNKKTSKKAKDPSQNSNIVIAHVIRSTELAGLIVDTIKQFIKKHNIDLNETPMFVSSEGLSFGSTGDAALNLASYKGVMLSRLYTEFKDYLRGLYTYPPISLKSTAGCASKNMVKDKNMMINAFMNESQVQHPFKTALINGSLINKTAYIPCVDDIVDSYWALKTMLIKESNI